MIRNQFPKSVKSMRMLAVFYECVGDIVRAQDIYLDMIESNPEDKQSIKRLICLYRDSDMYSSAIQVMNKYIETN